MAVAPEALEQILAAITNPSGSGIEKASQALQKSLRQPQSLVPLLVVAQQSRDEAVRQLACVTMRRKVAPFWKRISSQEQAQLRTTLLTVLPSEQAPQVKKSMIELISEVARVSTEGDGDWPELLPFLQKYSSSPNDFDMQYALRLFASLLQTQSIGPKLSGFFNQLTTMFATGLQHKNSSIRSEALNAFLGLITVADSDQTVEEGTTPKSPQLDKLQEVVPMAIDSLMASVQEGHVKETERAMEFFSSFILNCVALKDHIADRLMKFMLFVIKNQNLNLHVRGQSVIILRSFCEFDPGLVLKRNLVGDIVKASIELQCEELKTASGESDDFDDDDEHPQDLGGLLLKGAADYFDESLVFEPAMNLATQLLQDPDEHKRKGGFHVLSVLADGVQLYMKDHIKQLVTFACAGMRDQSALVRRFAARTMSRFSYLLHPEVNKHHNLIIPAIFEVLDRPDEKDVILENACSTLEVFCSNMEDEVVPYLESLMSKLGLMFQTDNDTIRGSSLAAISSVAIAAKTAFHPYFEQVIKVLMEILQNQDESKEELRSRAMSCVGSIAKGVGRERFNVVLADFVKIGMNHLETENPGLREMTFVFFQDIAEVYGEALLKLETFGALMASLAESISIVADVTFAGLGGDDDDDEAESKREMAEFSNQMAEKMGFTVSEESLAVANGTSNGITKHESFDIESDDEDTIVQLRENERVDSVRNQFIDEKAAAILTIGVFCNHCGQAFMGAWLEKCLEWLSGSESDRDMESSTVLKALASTYDEILTAIHKANPSGSHFNRETEKVITNIYEFYIDRIESNLEREDVVEVIDYLSEAIKRFGQTSFVEIYAPLEDVLLKVFQGDIECLSATYAFHGERERPEVDAGVHSRLHDAALDLVLVLAKARGNKFGPSLKKFLPVIVKYNQSSQSPKIKSAVIAFFASLVESIPNLLVPLLKDIVDLAASLIPSNENVLNQNAAFCLGCVFEHVDPKHTEQHALRVLDAVSPLITVSIPDGADAAILGARDNAVSAVAKVMLAFKGAQSLPYDRLIKVLLDNVPLQKDMEENKYVYDALFYLWQAHSEKMMPNAGRQLTIFAVALAQDGLQEDIKEKIAQFVRLLVQSSPQLQQLADKLPVAHKQSLQRCFQ